MRHQIFNLTTTEDDGKTASIAATWINGNHLNFYACHKSRNLMNHVNKYSVETHLSPQSFNLPQVGVAQISDLDNDVQQSMTSNFFRAFYKTDCVLYCVMALLVTQNFPKS
jgi:hypothetical protein